MKVTFSRPFLTPFARTQFVTESEAAEVSSDSDSEDSEDEVMTADVADGIDPATPEWLVAKEIEVRCPASGLGVRGCICRVGRVEFVEMELDLSSLRAQFVDSGCWECRGPASGRSADGGRGGRRGSRHARVARCQGDRGLNYPYACRTIAPLKKVRPFSSLVPWRCHKLRVAKRAIDRRGGRRRSRHARVARGQRRSRFRLPPTERELFIDNLLVRIHFIIVMIRWTGLAPWEIEFPFPGSLTSIFLSLQQPVAAQTRFSNNVFPHRMYASRRTRHRVVVFGKYIFAHVHDRRRRKGSRHA